jgi:hypothetical protein
VQIGEAVVIRALARFVNIRLIANTIRVFFRSQTPARRRHIQASRPSGNSRVVLRLRDRINAICVVVSKLGVVDHLRVDVNAGIDETDSVDV